AAKSPRSFRPSVGPGTRPPSPHLFASGPTWQNHLARYPVLPADHSDPPVRRPGLAGRLRPCWQTRKLQARLFPRPAQGSFQSQAAESPSHLIAIWHSRLALAPAARLPAHAQSPLSAGQFWPAEKSFPGNSRAAGPIQTARLRRPAPVSRLRLATTVDSCDL